MAGNSSADPHHFDSDPDPACLCDADPDPDLLFQLKPQSLEKVLKKAHISYILACLQIDADPDTDPACYFDPDPAYRFDTDPDPTFLYDADPDQQHWKTIIFNRFFFKDRIRVGFDLKIWYDVIFS